MRNSENNENTWIDLVELVFKLNDTAHSYWNFGSSGSRVGHFRG
jgi:hypothetical protein